METIQQLVELYDKKFGGNNFHSGPTGLYEPVNHMMNMKGKRLRPLLLLLSCQAFGGNVQSALNAAFAMELFHNFTLVHDDIMDEADIRRGQPSVHKQYGLNAGILAGDVMLAYTYKYLVEMPGAYIEPVLRLFNKTAIEIFEGQQMDMEFETRREVSEAEYLKMIEFKTSVLLACCLETGAIFGGANADDRKLIYDFGLKLGLSFQIKDDYLDAFGEEDKVGKKTGGDILQNKKTYLFIRAWKEANASQKEELQSAFKSEDSAAKIKRVKALFESTGAKQQALNKADALYKEALDSLRNLSINASARKPLDELALKINSREF